MEFACCKSSPYANPVVKVAQFANISAGNLFLCRHFIGIGLKLLQNIPHILSLLLQLNHFHLSYCHYFFVVKLPLSNIY